MSFIFEPTVRKLSLVGNLCGAQAVERASAQEEERIRCADKSLRAVFPCKTTKVAVINVDTAGREVLLSGQEGICVQWR